jgi:hypothetical protein
MMVEELPSIWQAGNGDSQVIGLVTVVLPLPPPAALASVSVSASVSSGVVCYKCKIPEPLSQWRRAHQGQRAGHASNAETADV